MVSVLELLGKGGPAVIINQIRGPEFIKDLEATPSGKSAILSGRLHASGQVYTLDAEERYRRELQVKSIASRREDLSLEFALDELQVRAFMSALQGD